MDNYNYNITATIATVPQTSNTHPWTITQAVSRFTNYLCGGLGMAPKTVELNTGIMRRWAVELGTMPSQVQMEDYIASKRMSGKTNTYARAIAINFQHYNRMLGKPTYLQKPKKVKGHTTNILSEAEVAVLISRTKDIRERAIMSTLAYSGIRNQELCNIKVSDVNIPSMLLRIRKAKGDDSRVVCIPGPCVDILVKYMQWRDGQQEDLLFITCRNKHILATQDVRKLVRVIADRVGMCKRVHPHLFRHSLASNMLHRGAGLLTIKEQLGHRYLESTLLYLHVNKDRLQADYQQYCPAYV